MKTTDLRSLVGLGEDSTRQFKLNIKNGESLASEMAALANSEGGKIFIGVADDGSNIRNPILVSFVAKGVLPYHGLGSGIKRALDGWSDIDFIDDREGCLFTAKVHRKKQAVPPKMTGKTPGKMTGKMTGKILSLLRDNPALAIPDLAEALGKSERTVERKIQELRQSGLLKRIGPAKGGYWEIIEIEND